MSWVPYERIYFVTAWRKEFTQVAEVYRKMAGRTELPWRWGASTMEPDKRMNVCVVAPGAWWAGGLREDMPWLDNRDAYMLPEFTTLCHESAPSTMSMGRDISYRSDKPPLKPRRVLDL